MTTPHHPPHDHPDWGHPVLGAASRLTDASRRDALALARTGQVFDLSHVIDAGAPFMAPNQTPFLLSTWASWRDSIRRRRAAGFRNDAGSNLERIEMTTHVGTHIDALGHFSIGEKLYGGADAAEAMGDWGLNRLGIEHIPPLITRGVLIDVADLDGGSHLAPGRVVTPAELAARTPVTLAPGDVVLIRTGWGRWFGVDNRRYLEGEPGIDVPAARWLTGQGVVAIGADTMAVEVLPNPDHGLALPVHQHVLAEAGVHLIENLVLDELAAAAARVFCFVLLAVKFRGATGSPARPVALI